MAGIHKCALCLGVIAAAAGLSACSGAPDVEIESPLLGKLGLTGGGPKREAKLLDRPPLVPPPTKKLPVPGSEQPTEAALDWPVDPGNRKKELAALKKQKQKEYEEKGD